MRVKYWALKLFCLLYDFKRTIFLLTIILILKWSYLYFFKNQNEILNFLLIFPLIGANKFCFFKIGECLQFTNCFGKPELTMRGSLYGLSDKEVFGKFNNSFESAYGNNKIANAKGDFIFIHTHSSFAKGILKKLYIKSGIIYTNLQWNADNCMLEKNEEITLVDMNIRVSKRLGVNYMLAAKYGWFCSREKIETVFEKTTYYDLYIPKVLFIKER